MTLPRQECAHPRIVTLKPAGAAPLLAAISAGFLGLTLSPVNMPASSSNVRSWGRLALQLIGVFVQTPFTGATAQDTR